MLASLHIESGSETGRHQKAFIRAVKIGVRYKYDSLLQMSNGYVAKVHERQSLPHLHKSRIYAYLAGKSVCERQIGRSG